MKRICFLYGHFLFSCFRIKHERDSDWLLYDGASPLLYNCVAHSLCPECLRYRLKNKINPIVACNLIGKH